MNITNNIISLIFTVVFAFIFYYLGQIIFKKFNIAPPIFQLFVGLLFGVGGLAILTGNDIFYFFNNPKYFPTISSYNPTLLWLMFFGAGFSLDLRNLRQQGKNIAKLSFIPVYTEIFLMTLVTLVLIRFIPGLDFTLNLVEILIIVILFAMASPANVIPATTAHLQAGRTGNNNIASDMIVASVLDNFTPIVFFFVAVRLLSNPNTNIVTNVVSTIIFLVIIIAIGFMLGYIVNLIINSIKETNTLLAALIAYVSIVLVILGLGHVPLIKDVIDTFAVILAMATGSAIKFFDKTGQADKVGAKASLLFLMFGAPMIFLSTGASIDLSIYTKIAIVGFVVLFISISITIKSITTYFTLSDKAYKWNDKKYAISAFIPKGITLINFSYIILVVSPKSTVLIDTMVLIAAFAILVTIPLGVSLISNNGKAWLKNK